MDRKSNLSKMSSSMQESTPDFAGYDRSQPLDVFRGRTVPLSAETGLLGITHFDSDCDAKVDDRGFTQRRENAIGEGRRAQGSVVRVFGTGGGLK